MLYSNVCLETYGYELPENIVSTEEIEKELAPLYDRLKLPYGRLEKISGIKERRFWNNGVLPSEISTLAAKKVIQQADISKDDIGCLIHTSVCRDFLEPSTASIVHNAVKLPAGSSVFDLSNACLGFLNGIIVLANMIELGQVKAGLIVAGENGKHLIYNTIKELLLNENIKRKEMKPYFASLTIGSGAVALILTHSSISKTGHRLLGGQIGSSTEHSDLCVGGRNHHVAHEDNVLMQTDSSALMVHGIELSKRTWEKFKYEFGWNNETLDRVFCHQVGSENKKALYRTLNLDVEKDFSTLEYLGNTGSASLPITMAIGIEKGLVKKGDKVGMFGIGSGINCVMLGVEW